MRKPWMLLYSVVSKRTDYLRSSFGHFRIRNMSSTSYNIPDLMKQKLQDLVTWYEEMTGMDEVRYAQNRVLQAEEQFKAAQEKRREATVALSEIQSKLRDLYSELDTTRRGEERYVFLITQEQKLLKEDRLIQDKFRDAEKQERDFFSTFSSSVKESHEKERAQAERTKYWSIIGSIIGTVIGIVGTSINNQFKMNELRKLVEDSISKEQWDVVNTSVITNEEKLKNILQIIQNTSYSDTNSDKNFELVKYQQDFCTRLSQIADNLDDKVRTLEHSKASLYNSDLILTSNIGTESSHEHEWLKKNIIFAALTGVIVTLLFENFIW